MSMTLLFYYLTMLKVQISFSSLKYLSVWSITLTLLIQECERVYGV